MNTAGQRGLGRGGISHCYGEWVQVSVTSVVKVKAECSYRCGGGVDPNEDTSEDAVQGIY